MWEYTYKNHAFCTYNDEHRHRVSPNDEFGYHLSPIQRKIQSFVDECINSAKLIRESTDLPITVLYSGGIDSEIVMESFRLAGISIKAAFCRYENNYNKHDLKYVEKYCDYYNIKLDIVDLNLVKFWENQAYDYAELVGCITPQLLPGLWLMDQLDGCLVAATGDVEFRRQDDGVWRYIIDEGHDVSWNRFAEIRQREIVPCFPEYTSEQLYANLNLKWFKKFVNNQVKTENNTMCNKPLIYEDFNLISRPKFTGFELVQTHDQKLRDVLEENLSQYNGKLSWTWKQYVEILLGVDYANN